MLSAMFAGLTAASRGKVRSLVSLSRRLSTDPAGSFPPESPAPLPDIETPAEKQRRPKKDPSDCSVLLFPGQGSQFVGMGRGLLKYPNVKEMFTVARKILGYDLLSLCLEGPEEELMKTVHCQPAVFITSLAAVERLNQENPKVDSSLFLEVMRICPVDCVRTSHQSQTTVMTRNYTCSTHRILHSLCNWYAYNNST